MPPTRTDNTSPKSHSQLFAKQFGAGTAPTSPPTHDSPAASPLPAGDKLPSAFSLFPPSSQLVRKNLVSFVILILLPGAYLAVLQLALNPKTVDKHIATWLGPFVIFGLFSLVTFAAKPLLELRVVQGQRLQFLQAVKGSFHYYWRLLGLYIVFGFLLFIGILLFIVPGLIVYRRYALAAYFLIDRDISIGEAMNQSAAITKGYSSAIWGIVGVQILLSISSWIPFIGYFIGVFFGMLYSCAGALRYEQFKALAPLSTPSHEPTSPIS